MYMKYICIRNQLRKAKRGQIFSLKNSKKLIDDIDDIVEQDAMILEQLNEKSRAKNRRHQKQINAMKKKVRKKERYDREWN